METQANERALFLFVSGAGSCVGVPDLIAALVDSGYEVYSVLTPNVALVTDPQVLMDVPGNHWIRDYGEPPLDVYPFGTLLVAPCTFNTFNKIALGIADNLATAMIGDGIGAGNRVVIAPGMNKGQWANPRVKLTLAQLNSWGVEIVEPRVVDGRLTLAGMEEILGVLGSPMTPH